MENNTSTRPIQYQMSNGNWLVASSRDYARTEDSLVTACSLFQGKPVEEIRAMLDAGKALRFGTDWYENVRREPAPVVATRVELVHCSCGHNVPRAQVMSASMGTSCPHCYDRMSE
jgi:hypothetical protein